MPYHPLWASQFFYHLCKIFLVLSSLCWNYLERFFFFLAGLWLIHHLKIVSMFVFFSVSKIFICSSFIATCFCLLILNTFTLKSFPDCFIISTLFYVTPYMLASFRGVGFHCSLCNFWFLNAHLHGNFFFLSHSLWFYDCFVRTKWLRAFALQACHCSKSGAHTKYVLGGWLCTSLCFLALLQGSSLFLAPLLSR